MTVIFTPAERSELLALGLRLANCLTRCVCEDYESGTREIPISAVRTCPVHPSKTFMRGPSGMWS